jgi:hypothetical protein
MEVNHPGTRRRRDTKKPLRRQAPEGRKAKCSAPSRCLGNGDNVVVERVYVGGLRTRCGEERHQEQVAKRAMTQVIVKSAERLSG